MDRISHSTAIDIGGGRMGFRSKDTVAGIPGTVVPAGWLNPVQEEIMKVIEACGFEPDSADWSQLAQAIQSGGVNWAIATGTANAWVVAPALAILAYKAGRPFRIKPPATNTSTIVNANISTIGDRRIKKSDGADPAIGDLHVDRYLEVFDDGVNLRVLSTLPSDVIAGLNASPSPPQLNFFELTTLATQSVGSSVVTVVTDFSVSGSKASDAAFSAGGTITVGPKTAGIWTFSQTYLPSQSGGAPSITQAYLQKNGVSVQNQTVNGTFCTNSGVVRVAAGDTLRMAVWQNSGTPQTNQHLPALPQATAFNLYHISS